MYFKLKSPEHGHWRLHNKHYNSVQNMLSIITSAKRQTNTIRQPASPPGPTKAPPCLETIVSVAFNRSAHRSGILPHTLAICRHRHRHRGLSKTHKLMYHLLCPTAGRCAPTAFAVAASTHGTRESGGTRTKERPEKNRSRYRSSSRQAVWCACLVGAEIENKRRWS